jgi:hypothetical protein
MKALILLAIVAAVVVPPVFMVPIAAQMPMIAGTYLAVGSGDKMTYQGYVDVKAHGGLYGIHWELQDGSEMVGVAFVDGDVMSMIFQDATGSVGFGFYRLRGSEWVGKWSAPGAPDAFPETWTPTSLTIEQFRARFAGKGAGA